jgi:catechol 2,3-dioxygenase-like lactoylglutathione lyase family enzyme
MELAAPAVDIGYVTSHVEAMLAFYGEGLELEQVMERTITDSDGNVRTVHCFAAGSTLLKLWTLHGGPPPKGPDERLGQVGIRYTTMHVRDVEAVVSRLRSLGYPIDVAPHRSALAGRALAFVRDPDGNYIELVETDATS